MRILKSTHGLQIGLDADMRFMAPMGVRVGEHGSQWVYGAPNYIEHIDDFVGTTILGNWGVNKGSDAATVNFAINQALCGTVRATTGAGAGGTMAVNGVQINSGLNYQANNVNSGAIKGGTYVEVRSKLSAITNIALFVGFTNQVAALQMPTNGAGGGDTFTATANDAVGFVFDTTMTTKNYWLCGTAGGVQATQQNTGAAPVAATYDTLRVELDLNGNAVFFRNGKQVGVLMAGAVTKTVALTPVVAAFTRTAASATVDIDYIAVGTPRV